MKMLGIDFGKKKIGLAIFNGFLVEPLMVIRDKKRILDICQEEKIEKIVLGIPEGKMVQKIKKFKGWLEQKTGLPVDFQDETLTSKEAVAKMKEIGRKIKEEDAISAALILEAYLEKNV